MTKQEIQNKLQYIVRTHDTVAKANGYSAATDIRTACFWDLVRMIEKLLEMDNGQKVNIREVGPSADRRNGNSGS